MPVIDPLVSVELQSNALDQRYDSLVVVERSATDTRTLSPSLASHVVAVLWQEFDDYRMSLMQPHTATLNVAGIGHAHDCLSGHPIEWPEPGGIDTAGIQLLVSAARSGHAIPKRLLFAEEVQRQAMRLCIQWPPGLFGEAVSEAAQ